MNSLRNAISNALDTISTTDIPYTPTPKEIGRVTSVLRGIAVISGLQNVGYEEVVRFQGGTTGIAFNLEEESVGVILLDETARLEAGFDVERTNKVIDIPVGNALLSRVIDPLARPLDGKGAIQAHHSFPIEQQAPPIIDRLPVSVPLQTGIKAIDALIPIGHGQRELILGDRQTGKTAIAIDTIVNQKNSDVICIYCSIGQRCSSVAKVIDDLKEKEAMDHTVVVVAEGEAAAGLRYICPYAATRIAEQFAAQGKKVLIVYDSLSNHAKAYRELSLLLRRPPGREAYPGDIFYIHARLLERATHLSEELGGGSITALPIVETEGEDISAYIPTNLISITDGQIILSADLFERGILPAISIGKSVSRVGGKAQLPAYREIASHLKLSYAQFEELEAFSRYGTQLDAKTQAILEHGKRIRFCLQQKRLDPLAVDVQTFILLAYSEGLLDRIILDHLDDADVKLREAAHSVPAAISLAIISGQPLSSEAKETMLKIATTALEGVQ
jgi:F-type H+-transporting ATPase subunit alpha